MSSKPPRAEAPDTKTGIDGAPDLKTSELAPYWLTAIIESADDAIVSKTLEGIITSWNKGAERIFGYTADEVVGKSITILIPEERLHEEPITLAKLARGERIEHFETVRVRKDRSLVDISLTVSPIRGADGTIIGASKIARDISERRQAEQERARLLAHEQEARQEAEEANRLKDEFLATLSHELRTPLTAILGWAYLLRSGKLGDRSVTDALETIERNARAQSQLIDDLLDISRIITGQIRLDVRQVEPDSFIESAIEALRPAAEAKGVRVQKVIDTGVKAIWGDAARLQQVVWNLLSNAIKFTPRGGSVQVRLERVNSHIEIAVADTGAGIPPKFLPYVFDRFRQADQTTTRHYGGLGLGLAIVRHLIELHGGTVYAESLGEGQGATFTAKLPVRPIYNSGSSSPVERVHPVPREMLSSFGGPERLDGVRVLVVDDETDAREMIRIGLGQCGAEVTTAASVQEALEALKAARPEIMISDIGMPDEDGYELIKRVRALAVEDGGRVPAIALTAYARTEDRLRALRAGYQMHVTKPVDLPELVAVMASLIQRNG